MNKHNVEIAKFATILFAFHFLSLGTFAWGQTTPPKFHPGLLPERARILFGRTHAGPLFAQKTRARTVAQAMPPKNVCKPACDEFRTKVKQNGSMMVLVDLNIPNLPDETRAPKDKRATVLQARKQAISEAQDRLLRRMAAHNVKVHRKYTSSPGLAITVNAAALEDLIADPEVVRIYENKSYHLMLRQSVPQIGADQAWAKGFTGAGYAIAVLDDGVDAAHPFLTGKIIGANQACFSGSTPGTTSLCPNGETVQIGPGAAANCSSDCDHGTHVAGIAAGNGTGFSGVAKDAKVMAIQVFSLDSTDKLRTFDSDLQVALDFVREVGPEENVVAVNMSLGTVTTFSEHCDDSALKSRIDALRAVGIATVAASGDDGTTNAISDPACVSTAVSVGAVTKVDSTTHVERVAEDSNSASFLSLLAPGGDGSTGQADGSPTYSASCSEGFGDICSSMPTGSPAPFAYLAGTSMAVPHVAGAIAVLKQGSPTANVTDLLSVLQSSGVPITDPKNGITKPRIKFDDTWVVRYPSNGRYPVAIFTDALGNAYVAGSMMDPSGSGTESYAVVKYDPSGNQLWAQLYNGGTWSEASAAAIDGSGNTYITGMVCAAVDSNSNCVLASDTVKFDSNGNQTWVGRLADGGASNYNGVATSVDNSANVYVASLKSAGTSFGNFVYAVTKYNASGNQLWTSTYTNAGQDFPYALAIDASGNVYVTGESFDCGPPDACGAKAATVKFGPNGNQLWAARDGNFDVGRAIAVDASGNIYLAGFKSQSTTAVVKYDPSGTSLWTSPSLSDMSTVNAITLDASGSIFATGIYGYLDNGAKTKLAVIKYDSNGSQLWTALDDPNPGGLQAEGDAIAVDSNGNVYVAGIQNESTVTLKHSATGELMWSAFLGGNSGSFPALAVFTGNVYMTTSGENAEFSTDFLTAKYAPQ